MTSGPPASPVPNIMDIIAALDRNTNRMGELIDAMTTPSDPPPDVAQATGYEDAGNAALLGEVTENRQTNTFDELRRMETEILYRMEHGCRS